jgi:hypothetical protein
MRYFMQMSDIFPFSSQAFAHDFRSILSNFYSSNSGVKAPLGGKSHVKNRKYSSLDLEIDPS